MIKIQQFDDGELQQFKHYQRLTFGILEETAANLSVGDSEHDITRVLRKKLHEAGAHNHFHVPVALFGKRSAYPGEFGAFEALPTPRKLEQQDTVILDAAPVFNGYTVDTSYAFNFSGTDVFKQVDRELPRLRKLILDQINAGKTFQQIAWQVDDDIREHGFDNCHRKHIGAVLGHVVSKATSQRMASLTYKGLAVKQVSWFLARSILSRFNGNKTPNWNHTNASKGVAPFGLWAVEPHLARGNVGVKFEEIMVIDENGARWLDNDLPHHRRWAELQN